MNATEEAKVIAARIKTVAQDLEGGEIGMLDIPVVETALASLEEAADELWRWAEDQE